MRQFPRVIESVWLLNLGSLHSLCQLAHIFERQLWGSNVLGAGGSVAGEAEKHPQNPRACVGTPGPTADELCDPDLNRVLNLSEPLIPHLSHEL